MLSNFNFSFIKTKFESTFCFTPRAATNELETKFVLSKFEAGSTFLLKNYFFYN